MSSRIFDVLLEDKIEQFKSAFLNLSRQVFFDDSTRTLIHPGEFGMYRESIVIEFLKFITPSILSFDTGFLINDSGDVSTQADIIVFDKSVTPLIETGLRQRFFPIESVAAVGEVKSKMSKEELRRALGKLAKMKQIRENIKVCVYIRKMHRGEMYDPRFTVRDQIITFLICESFDFDIKDVFNEIRKVELVDPSHSYNFILSIKDGLILHRNRDAVAVLYPILEGLPLQRCMYLPTEPSKNEHIKIFSNYFFMSTATVSILYPEMSNYMTLSLSTRVDDET